MENLIVIANLARVRPVKFRSAGEDPREKAHLVEMPESALELKPVPISELVTDQAGRTSQSGPGEENHLKTELDRKAMERIAGEISDLVAAENPSTWRLVAPSTILSNLKDALHASARKSLAETETGDLTSLPLQELEKRFLKAN